MPTALVLTLRPLTSAVVAPHLGRSSHASLLHAVAERDTVLAQHLHDGSAIKPLAASDLLGAPISRQARTLQPDRTYTLRWCGLSRELDTVLREIAQRPSSMITLDHAQFAVEHATINHAEDALAGTAEWEELVALDRVGREPPPDRWTLHFRAATTFRSNGRNIPLPLPELIFGSLLDRWNNAAVLRLPAEVRRFANECLLLNHYDLRSVWVPAYNAGETGFLGRCTLIATNYDRYYLHCCATLLRFAFFSGLGAKTSIGFGMVHVETGERKLRADVPQKRDVGM